MKKYLLLCLSFYLFALESHGQKKTVTLTQCLELKYAVKRQLTFSVNENQDSQKKTYPVRYRIKIYYDGNLETAFHLSKNTSDVVPITLKQPDLAKYCVQIRKHIFARIIFSKIHWTEEHNVTAALTPSHQGVYFVSTSNNFLPLVKAITSSDGTSGDGVKVLVD